MKEKLFVILLTLFCFGLAINFVKNIFDIKKRGSIIGETEHELENVKNKNEELKRELVRVESNEYIERSLRDKLNMGKEGETMVIIPSIYLELKITPTPTEDMPNWKKWFKELL